MILDWVKFLLIIRHNHFEIYNESNFHENEIYYLIKLKKINNIKNIIFNIFY
jgi:hypothetical protein